MRVDAKAARRGVPVYLERLRASFAVLHPSHARILASLS